MQKNMKITVILALSLVVLVNVVPNLCKGSDRSKEIYDHVETLKSGSLIQKITSAKIITRSGYRDDNLFKIIETELLGKYKSATGEEQIDYISWLCKALASSGMEKYKPALEEIYENSTNNKIKKYAKQSLDLFEEYQQRVKIIAKSDNQIQGRDPEVARLMNMLQSDMMELKRDAAKLITRDNYSDPALFELLNTEILAGYQTANDKIEIDTIAWLCKALASSNNPEYKNTLQEIINSSQNSKLVKYADKSLKMMN